ncbi:hypothetical protein ACSSS7_003338 [Eimeria intestinalis]
MYARKDIGTAAQKVKVWRCYAESSLQLGVSGENCVDDCGNMKSCFGAVVGASPAHLTNTAALEAVINSNKKTDCSMEQEGTEPTAPETSDIKTPTPQSLQDILDESCQSSGEEACTVKKLTHYCGVKMYARKDIGTAAQKVKVWRCYAESSLQLGVSGENCVDDCGNMKSCFGAVVGASPAHLTNTAALEAVINSNKKTNCSMEQEGTEPTAPETSDIKKVLDARCMAKFAKECLQNEAYCVYGVARKNQSWRCYPRNRLSSTGMSSSCVDDCGNTAYCAGELPAAGSTSTEAEELQGVIDGLKAGFCIMHVGSSNSISMLFAFFQD